MLDTQGPDQKGPDMQNINDQLRQLALEAAAIFGVELVDAQLKGKGKGQILRVYIDKEGGVGLDDCEAVSRQLSARLDVEDIVPGSYILEVSSPGLDRPLKKKEDFQRSTGKLIKVVTKEKVHNEHTFTGKLLTVTGSGIVIEIKETPLEISFGSITRARLEPDWNRTGDREKK